VEVPCRPQLLSSSDYEICNLMDTEISRSWGRNCSRFARFPSSISVGAAVRNNHPCATCSEGVPATHTVLTEILAVITLRESAFGGGGGSIN
jgi:hypothetical protein